MTSILEPFSDVSRRPETSQRSEILQNTAGHRCVSDGHHYAPTMDVLHTMRAIRQAWVMPQPLPIIALTPPRNESDREKCIEGRRSDVSEPKGRFPSSCGAPCESELHRYRVEE